MSHMRDRVTIVGLGHCCSYGTLIYYFHVAKLANHLSHLKAKKEKGRRKRNFKALLNENKATWGNASSVGMS